MSKMTSFRIIALALSMLMIIDTVKGRWLDHETYSTSMISYGVHNISNENPPNLELRISNSSTSYGEKRCESLYRFLPCANTMREGVLLMFLYTYLMISGEGWINKGGKVLYVWIGANEKVGESLFRVLMALPKIIVIVVPGILSSASDAQNQVVFGVNMYAGSTVITLTIVWGISIIFSGHKRSSPDSSIKCLSDSSIKCLSLLTDTSVNIDKKTAKIAVIMLLSLIPFAFAGLVSFVNTPAMTLIALLVSGVSLLVYFGYQVFNPWIGVRSLTYLQQENLKMHFLDYVKRLAEHVDLVDMDEKPDSTCLKSIFKIVDKNEYKSLTHDELIEKIFKLQNDSISKEYAKTVIFMNFDENKDEEISWEEFERGCTKLLKKLYKEAKKSESPYKVICDEILQTIKKRQDSKLSIIEIIMPSILKQVLEKKELVKEDGQPNREKIKGLFSDIDKDNNDEINKDELKQFIETLDSGIEFDHDRVLHALVEYFDDNKNNVVDKKEFVEGFIKWIEEAINHATTEKAIEKIQEVRKRAIIKQRSKLSIFEKVKPSVQKKVLKEKELVKKNGQPNRERIEGLFSVIDEDNDKKINRDELKQFIETLDFGIELVRDRVLDELVKEFVDDNINEVKKKEFVDGFIKWIKEVIDITEEIEKDIRGEVTLETWEKLKAIMYVISGVAIMITITSAFITSVKQFSSAARIPFLFTSFVLAPIAMKAKLVIMTFLKPHVRTNASLTFSEIYNELVMNNLLGLFSLLVTLYIKGLSWTYSAQVFTIMIPCAVVGIFTFRRYNYPLWASIPVILLYPLSVYIYFILANA